MIKTKGSISYINNTVKMKIFSLRLLVVCLIQGIFHDSYGREISLFAKEYHECVSPFLFPLMCGNLTFIMIFGFCVLYMYSEVPFMNQKEMYCIARTGRYKWLFAQEITITLLAVFLIMYSFLIDIVRLFPRVSFADAWDRIEMSLAYGTISADGVAFEMDLLQMYSPWSMLLYGSVMGFLVVNLVGHMMYTLSLVFSRLVAVVVGSVLALMPIVTFNSSNMYAIVYYISPFSWISPGYLIRSISVPDMAYKVLFCVIGVIVCVGIDCIVMRKRDFEWNMEE